MDFENISFYQEGKEVLLFPFSAFVIKELQEISIKNVRCYQIKLLYLGKFLKELNNNKKDENIIPDSQFKNQLLEFGLLGKDSVSKSLLEKYNEYKEELKSKK